MTTDCPKRYEPSSHKHTLGFAAHTVAVNVSVASFAKAKINIVVFYTAAVEECPGGMRYSIQFIYSAFQSPQEDMIWVIQGGTEMHPGDVGEVIINKRTDDLLFETR